MKPKTAEKSDSTEPKRQNESTRERVLQPLLCSANTAFPTPNLAALPKLPVFKFPFRVRTP
jgi:hypothetical protein